MNATVEAVKFDTSKLRFELIPPSALAEVAKILTVGAAKYGDRNWENGMYWGRVYSALQRHANAFWAGESFDPEGFHHMGAVAVNAMFLYIYDTRNLGTDNRSL